MEKRAGVYIHIDAETDKLLSIYVTALPPQVLPNGDTRKWSKGSLAALAIKKYLVALQQFVGDQSTLNEIIAGLKEVDPSEIDIQGRRDLQPTDAGLKEF